MSLWTGGIRRDAPQYSRWSRHGSGNHMTWTRPKNLLLHSIHSRQRGFAEKFKLKWVFHCLGVLLKSSNLKCVAHNMGASQGARQVEVELLWGRTTDAHPRTDRSSFSQHISRFQHNPPMVRN